MSFCHIFFSSFCNFVIQFVLALSGHHSDQISGENKAEEEMLNLTFAIMSLAPDEGKVEEPEKYQEDSDCSEEGLLQCPLLRMTKNMITRHMMTS